MSYDSRPETWLHIDRVCNLLADVQYEFMERARKHDRSKLEGIEREAFDRVTPRLRSTTYGSEEYKASLREIKPAIHEHYARYPHHPEHHDEGIHGMTLVDLIEMLADWKAASERHPDGDLGASFAHNRERFGYGDEIDWLLRRTAVAMGWARLDALPEAPIPEPSRRGAR